MSPQARERFSAWAPVLVSLGGSLIIGGIAWGATHQKIEDHERRITAGETKLDKQDDVLQRLDKRSSLIVCKLDPHNAECP